ncbi:MAG: phosphoribosylglycinamide formyltransferase [Rhodanobacteraceae bacterium]|nr:phosphoribosylglycinamide formyltransferase [Rhodanobacteraceae bacterium]
MSASTEPLRVAVLLSGRGSNLLALIKASQRDLPIALVGAFSNKADAPGLGLAAAAGIPTQVFEPRLYPDRAEFEQALFAAVAASGAELLVLAGFMRVLGAASVEQWRGRLINIHPSLLPKYQGLHTHERAIQAGDSEHGASVHFVTPVLDGGPVLMQVRVPIEPGDTADSLAARLLPEEHRLLVAAVRLFAQRRVRLDDGRIFVDGVELVEPLRFL